MNDKERILMEIISELASTQILGPASHGGGGYHEAAYQDKTLRGDLPLTHFAYSIQDEDLKPGMLVLCQTMGINDWKVGFIVKRLEYGRCLIREIGSERVCDVGNERFLPILGLTERQLLEGDRYQFYLKVQKAFSRGDEYFYRFGGVTFEEHEAVIWVRDYHGGFLKYRQGGSLPFAVRLRWNKRTSVKAILEAMRAAGYGTREFDAVIPEEGEAWAQKQAERKAKEAQAKAEREAGAGAPPPSIPAPNAPGEPA